MPRITDMLAWGIVKPGDQLKAKGKDIWAELMENGHVLYNGKEMSMHGWLHEVFGWSSVESYVYAEYKDTGKSLAQMRREYMQENNIQ